MAAKTGWLGPYLCTAQNGLGEGGRRKERAHSPLAYRSSVKRPGTLPSQPTPGGVVQAPLSRNRAAWPGTAKNYHKKEGEGAAGLRLSSTGQPQSRRLCSPPGISGAEEETNSQEQKRKPWTKGALAPISQVRHPTREPDFFVQRQRPAPREWTGVAEQGSSRAAP